jgi:hypothetical protein
LAQTGQRAKYFGIAFSLSQWPQLAFDVVPVDRILMPDDNSFGIVNV